MHEVNHSRTKDNTCWNVIDIYPLDGIYNTTIHEYVSSPLCEFCKAPSSYRMVRKSTVTGVTYRHYICFYCKKDGEDNGKR